MKFSRIAKAALTLALGVVAGVAFAARSDVNGIDYAEDFESNPGGFWANGVPTMAQTNGWYAGTADQSYVTNMAYTLPGDVESPISGPTSTRVLRLNTEGATLTNEFDNPSFASGKLYMDTLVKFVVSEDLPTAISNTHIKTAIFLKADGAVTNLYVYHGTKSGGVFTYGAPTFTAITNTLALGEWVRVTVALDAITGDDSLEAFQVFLNGQAVVSANGYSATGWKTDAAPDGGSWFISAMRRAAGGSPNNYVDSLAFQGTGFIDDLVLNNDNPFVPAVTFFTITQNVGANGSENPAGAVTIASGASTTLVYTANSWYRINTLDVDAVNVPAATGAASYNLTLGPVTANMVVDVDFVAATPAQTGYPVGIPNSWLDDFGSEGFTQDTDGIGIDTEYLLNTDPTANTTYSFDVTSVKSAADSVEVKVVLTRDTVHGNVNGTLRLYGRASLTSGSWGLIGSTDVTGWTGAEQTYTFTDTANTKFYKAVIE